MRGRARWDLFNQNLTEIPHIQGSANPQTPGSENKRIKSCVFLPAAGRRTQLFQLIFTEPGVCIFADPCSWRKSCSSLYLSLEIFLRFAYSVCVTNIGIWDGPVQWSLVVASGSAFSARLTWTAAMHCNGVKRRGSRVDFTNGTSQRYSPFGRKEGEISSE